MVHSDFLVQCVVAVPVGTLLVAGIAKLVAPSGLADLINQFLPTERAIFFARCVGFLEVSVGPLLLVARLRPAGLVMLSTAGVAFVAFGLARTLSRNMRISCGCFGSLSVPFGRFGWHSLVFGLVVIGAVVVELRRRAFVSPGIGYLFLGILEALMMATYELFRLRTPQTSQIGTPAPAESVS